VSNIHASKSEPPLLYRKDKAVSGRLVKDAEQMHDTEEEL
jgi:hypothetical protein